MPFKTTKAFKAFIPAALFSVAGCVSATAQTAADDPKGKEVGAASKNVETAYSPGTLLRPYYQNLKVDLPQANLGPSLDLSKRLTRIAFGSCNHQGRSQHMWPKIASLKPDLMLAIGDNVYGDFGYQGEADLGSFIDAYRQQASFPEFRALRSQVPMLATWDDHDFGPNDSGGSFAFKQWSEQIFESFWRSNDDVKSRPGIYDSIIAGPEGQRVQIIMLDTRFFRSPLKALPYQDPRPPLGRYVANDDPSVTILGDQQWAWLAEQLAKPAELRLVVTSIQVLTDAHGFEKWGNMPLERERLFGALNARNGGDFLILSGDRHSGAIYSETPDSIDAPVWELTSSSLNLAFVRDDASEREPDPKRRTDMITQENFGLVDIDWQRKTVGMTLLDAGAKSIVSQSIEFGKQND